MASDIVSKTDATGSIRKVFLIAGALNKLVQFLEKNGPPC